MERAVDRIIDLLSDEPPIGQHRRAISEEQWDQKETVEFAGEWLGPATINEEKP
ncbi:hypothetical protein [Streptomyces sp. KL116D]|uniref:hypothetical protein n=1 Tax=Streptomyces sp. KL116D TaxID=3045152 RepID=UPI0035578226